MTAEGENREWAVDPVTGGAMEVRVVPGPPPGRSGVDQRFRRCHGQAAHGLQVGSIAWQTTVPAEPEQDEIRIAVTATGLNFRDVMWAMGMLPEEALEDGFAGPTIGMECAGYVEGCRRRRQ